MIVPSKIVPNQSIRAAGVTRIAARAVQPRLAVIVAAMAAFVVAGASAAWSFPWSIDMFRGPAIQPLEVSPRVMPEGTLPTDTRFAAAGPRAGDDQGA